MIQPKHGLLATFLIVQAQVVSAQNCDLNLTVEETIQAGIEEALKNATETGTQTATRQLNDIETGVSIASSSAASTIKDFLPFLSISGLGGSLSGENSEQNDNNDVLTFDLNIPIEPAIKGDLNIQATVNRSPKLFEPLREQFESAELAGTASDLEKSLEAGDDVQFTLTYNLNTDSLGRSIEDLALLEYAKVFATPIDEYSQGLTDALSSKELDVLVSADNPAGEVALKQLLWEQVADKSKQQQACEALKAWGRADAQLQLAESRFSNLSHKNIATLVSNRPQLYFSVSSKERNIAVGPDEIAAKLTFEWGYRANLNQMLAAAPLVACTDGRSQKDCAEALSKADEWVQAKTTREGLMSDRLKLELEYVDIEDYNYVQDEFGFDKDGSEKFIGSVSYGRAISNEFNKQSRLDLMFKFEDVDGDADRNDRTIGSVTYTKSFGEISIPFSLVYSNKPEYVMQNTDENISANIGIKFDFDQ